MQGHWSLADHAEPYCRALDGVGVHHSSDLFALYADGQVESLVRETGIPRLWLDTLRDLGQQEPESFRRQLETLIRDKGLQRAVPTPKEVRSDVCWARVYPVVFDL